MNERASTGPSPDFPGRAQELQDANRQRRQANDELSLLKETLERRVAERTAELAHANAAHRRIGAGLRESEERFRQLADSMPQIVFTARPDGEVEHLNRRWYDYTGLPEGDTRTESWLSALHPDDCGRCLAEGTRSRGAGVPFEMELRFRESRTGEYRWHLSRSLPARDGGGRIIRWYGTSTDIHDRKLAATFCKVLS